MCFKYFVIVKCFILLGIGTEDSSKSGVSNMLYANVRMSDLSEGEQANTTYELARPVSEDFLKEEEIIDGELAAESESNTGKVDDTYYNVTGKRVAVENLPEYIRNRSRGDIYADFQVRHIIQKVKKKALVKFTMSRNKVRLCTLIHDITFYTARFLGDCIILHLYFLSAS